MTARRLLALLAVAALAGCAPTVERVGMGEAQWHPSPNFNERRAAFVVLHHAGDDRPEDALATLTSSLREISAHYLVTRAAFDGELVPQDPNDEPASVLLERIRAERVASMPAKPQRGRRTTATA